MKKQEIKLRPRLPLKGNAELFIMLSLVVALILSITTLAGLIKPSVYYPGEKLLTSFIPTDSINLVLGFPLLLYSIFSARKGSLTGLLTWPGMLFYVLYIYIPYMLIVPFSYLFPFYVIIVTVSTWLLIGILINVDAEIVKHHLKGKVKEKFTSILLIGLALLIITRQSVRIVLTLKGSIPLDTHEVALWIDDFVIAAPALLTGGILLFRKNALGYLLAPGLLLAYGLLSLGLIPYYLYYAIITKTSAEYSSLITVAIMAVLCFIPFMFFIINTRKVNNKKSEEG